MTNSKQVDALIETVAEIVEIIEGLPMTTQGHYGDYLAILGRYKTMPEVRTMGILLLKAGANAKGVRGALCALGAMS